MARNGPTGPVWRCPLLGEDRKWLAEGQTGAFDPTETLAAPSNSAFDAGFRLIKILVCAAKGTAMQRPTQIDAGRDFVSYHRRVGERHSVPRVEHLMNVYRMEHWF